MEEPPWQACLSCQKHPFRSDASPALKQSSCQNKYLNSLVKVASGLSMDLTIEEGLRRRSSHVDNQSFHK